MKTVRHLTPIFGVLLSPMDCVVYWTTDSVGLSLLTAAGWFIGVIVTVAVAVAVVAGRPDTLPGRTTLPLVITTFCTRHSYQLGHVG